VSYVGVSSKLVWISMAVEEVCNSSKLAVITAVAKPSEKYSKRHFNAR
jgi:hypothetical protein